MAMRRAWLGLWLLMMLAWSAPARADKVADAAALFDAARDLAKKGQYEEACPKFEASHRLDEQLGTLINIADCYEHTGRVATAWARWEAAQEWAKREGDDRLDYVVEGLERVARRLPKLVVHVKRPVADLRIVRGEVELAVPMYGVALPVDPGTVTVQVLRGEQLLEERSVEVAEKQTAELQLDLAAIAAAHPVPADEPGGSDEPSAAGPDEPYDPTHRNIGLIVGAVGAAAVLVAVGLEIGALVKKGQADSPDSCVNQFCSPEGLDAADTAATFAEVGQWVGIGGLAVLAVGATIFFTAPSDDRAAREEARALELTPWLGADGAGLLVGGRF